jgi:hypothetical protein
MATITERTDERELNEFNITMRSQPWFQEWMRARGLNPTGFGNRKLNGKEQDALEVLVAQHYFDGRIPDGMTIDSGSSLNQKGGWAGMPTWAKVAIGAAVTAASMGAIPGVPGVPGLPGLGGSGSAAAGSSAASSALPTIGGTTAYGSGMAATAPSVLGSVAGTAGAGGGGLFSQIARYGPSIAAGGRMLGGLAQANAQNRGAEMEARFAHDALELAAQSDRRNAETDTYRKSLYGQLAEGYQPSARPDGVQGRHPQGFITDKAREAGSLMTQIAMDRLRNPQPSVVTPYSQLPTQPGLMEQIANYAGPAMSMFDPYINRY